MKSWNNSQRRWLPDRRNVTTILPCAKMTRDHPRKPCLVSRERFTGGVNRNRRIRASRAVYRRLCSLLVIISTASLKFSACSHIVFQVLGLFLFSSKAAECVMKTSIFLCPLNLILSNRYVQETSIFRRFDCMSPSAPLKSELPISFLKVTKYLLLPAI